MVGHMERMDWHCMAREVLLVEVSAMEGRMGGVMVDLSFLIYFFISSHGGTG